MQEYIPYCYLIGWTNLNKWYYGSEYSQKTKIANPSNLFNNMSPYSYKTSSKEVQRIIEQHGVPDVISIRKTFKTSQECRAWEHKVLRRMDVIHSEKWINKTNNKGISLECIVNVPKSAEHKRKIQAAARQRDYNGTNNPNYGKKHSIEARQKISHASRMKRHSESTKQQISLSVTGEKNGMYGVHRHGSDAPHFGRKHNDEAKLKMSRPRKSTAGMQNKMYITDGVINKKIDKNTAIPAGFRKGRS